MARRNLTMCAAKFLRNAPPVYGHFTRRDAGSQRCCAVEVVCEGSLLYFMHDHTLCWLPPEDSTVGLLEGGHFSLSWIGIHICTRWSLAYGANATNSRRHSEQKWWYPLASFLLFFLLLFFKASFAFAFYMDSQKEERERGVTIACATKEFYTAIWLYTIIDAPVHREFI